jgi:hypothetical protein
MNNEFAFPYRQSSVSLYSTSFLGYGQDEFHNRLLQRIVRDVPSAGAGETPVASGCFNTGYNVLVVRNAISYRVSGTGVIADCIPLLDEMTGPSTDCSYGDDQCSIGCAYQPAIPPNMVFYGSSSFFFIVSALISPLPNREISLSEIWTATQTACAFSFAELPANGSINKHRTCYQGAWLLSLLNRSMNFPLENTHFRVASSISGRDIAWPMGMAFYEVNKAVVPTCPPPATLPDVPTPTQQAGNVVINFANMFEGVKLCSDE